MKRTNVPDRSQRLTPAEKELLKRMKLAVIERYGSLSEGARALGLSRWCLRRAVLGKSSHALRAMEEAGILAPRASVAANGYAGTRIDITITASNDRAMTGNGWSQITPYGKFPNSQGLQLVTKRQAQDMVNAFNSLKSSQGASFRGVPVYVGHPDVSPDVYTDQRRYGRIDGLMALDDGLYASVSWNDLGEKNREEGYFVYPSGVWKFKRAPGGVIEPYELVSVGLTNQPNIPGVKPWAMNAANSTTTTVRYSRHGALIDMPAAHALNSIVEATTPGAARREAKQALKDHRSTQKNYSALTAIAKRQDHLRREKGLGEHEALLQAQVDLPESAAAAAAHIDKLDEVRQAEDRRKKVKEFGDAVHARMDRERLSYAEAWGREKKDRKKNNQWTPDDD